MSNESRAAMDAVKPVSRLDEPAAGRIDDEIFSRRPVYTIVLLALMGFLLLAGAANLYSASGGDQMFFSHMKQMSVGLTLFSVLALFVQPKHLNASAYWLYALICAGLVAVLVMGHIGWGARRWITIGPINGQPSEVAKIIVAIVAARFFCRNAAEYSV